MASGARTWVAVVIFAALLTTYVVVARAAGDRLVDTRLTLASTFAGALIAASWLAIGLDSSVDGPSALTVPLLVLGPVVAIALGYLTTTISGSIRSGAGHVGLTALTAGFALFLVWAGCTVTAAGRPYDAALLRDFRSSGFADVSTYAVNDSLGTAMMLLVLVPLLSATSGLVGAATARIRSADRPS
jgi:hypothetical protein